MSACRSCTNLAGDMGAGSCPWCVLLSTAQLDLIMGGRCCGDDGLDKCLTEVPDFTCLLTLEPTVVPFQFEGLGTAGKRPPHRWMWDRSWSGQGQG